MQSISARAEYRNSFHCACRIFTEEGILAFWAGALPRLSRLMVSCCLDCSPGNRHSLIILRYRSAEVLFSRCTRRLWKRSINSIPSENTSKTPALIFSHSASLRETWFLFHEDRGGQGGRARFTETFVERLYGDVDRNI